MKRPNWIVLVLTCSLILTMTMPTVASVPPTPPADSRPPLERLQQATGGAVRIAYHAQTGKVRFVGVDAQHAIPRANDIAATVSPEQAARAFLRDYGELFGLADQASELALMRSKNDSGRSFVRFQQIYHNVPIVGGELIVQTDADRNIISANGEILPSLSLDTAPRISAAQARQTALATVAKDYGLAVADLSASAPELWIYNPILLGGPGVRVNTLVWRIEVTPQELLPINEFVLVDARLGNIALHFNQIDTVKNRETYTANNGTSLPGALVCNESNPSCTGGDSHAIAAHQYAGATYDFYQTEHGRDGIDNAGMTMISTVHYKFDYQNAFWDGTQMVYGDAKDYPLAEDVVGHELTHGVTSYESNLFYFYQSGAINEAFSDLWGEFVDLFQVTDNDAGDTRWAMGEDIGGAIRNMQNPPLFGDPDKMSSANYACGQSLLYDGSGDNGGVHTNGGVNSKAVYLLTDGGSFNGKTVTALDYHKVADLYYRVQTTMLTSAADYADLYNSLIQACSDLDYTTAECQSVRNALDAVEMSQQPASCPAPEAPVCDSGTPANVFFDDIESGGGNWQAGSVSGTSYWYAPQNDPRNTLYNASYAASGTGNIWGFNQGDQASGGPPGVGGASDTFLAMQNAVAIPANAYLHFKHAYGFESNSAGSTFYDGGVLEYSSDGGAWTDAGSLITDNGYNGALSSSANPLNGRQAFAADSRGYISSRVNLSSLAGHNVKFRFRIGTDSEVYDYGWFIDDVRIYTCAVVQNEPNVGITKQVVGSNFKPGDYVTFTLTIANSGNAIAANVIVTDLVPAEVLTPTYDPGPLTITSTGSSDYVWEVEPLRAGGDGTITLYGQIDPGLADDFSFNNTASISAAGDATPSNNSDFVTVYGSAALKAIYLPLVTRIYPPLPDTPVLNAIDNNGGSSYTVSWNAAARADSYILEEATNSSFSGATTVYNGDDISWSASGKTPGTYYYRVKAHNSWGDSVWSNVQSARVTPPSIFYSTEDAEVDQGFAGVNFGSYNSMWVGYGYKACYQGSTDAKITRGLVKFNLASIPAGTSISQAKLYLKTGGACYGSNSSPRTVTIYRANKNWSESSVTWNSSIGYGEAYGSASVSLTSAGTYAFDITNLVRGWVNGTIANYGLMVRGPEGSGSEFAWFGFYTSESSSSDPYIYITYSGMAASDEPPAGWGQNESAPQSLFGILLNPFRAANDGGCTP